MADLFPSPRVSRNEQTTQLSYELRHRIYTVKSYPLQSVNGSTVLIYGQENGVKIVWRGGRQFKPPQEPSAAPKGKTNGTQNAVVLLDSDEEDTSSAPPFEDKPEFYAEEEEFDPENPYPSILQVLDLYFGSDVLHLAVLPASALRAEGVSWRGIAPLKQKIVFAAACADNKVRLVTLPLTPPSPASKARLDFHSDFTTAHAGNGKWGETVVVLDGHQEPSHGVSMTVEANSSSEPNIIVASYTYEVNGLLRLHRIPIKSPRSIILPFQSIYLSTPAKRIVFNPSLSEPRNSHLLVADSTGVCRIYDYKLLVKGQISDELVDNPAAEQGSWLLSLYPGFEKDPHNGAHAGFGRKTIIDAKWVANGGAVVVLLNDGEWAIWDIEDAKPGASQGLLGRQAIKGGSRSGYSISGWIEGPVKKSSGPPQITSSKFAPMTPGTRKNTDLFNGKGHSGASRGQIAVLELPPTTPTSPAEESIVFWLGDSFALIPNLSKYWVAHGRKGGTLFNSTPNGRLVKLDGINLQGERCIGVEQIVSRNQSGLPSEILVLGEHRFVVLTSGKAASQPIQSINRLALAETNTNNTSGELDVIGIDQALSRMENGSTKRKLLQR